MTPHGDFAKWHTDFDAPPTRKVSQAALDIALEDGYVQKVMSLHLNKFVGLSLEDRRATAVQAVWKCLTKHRFGRQKFVSSLYQFLIWEAAKTNKVTRALQSRHAPLQHAKGREGVREDRRELCVEDPSLRAVDDEEAVAALLSSLTPRQKAVVTMRHLEKKSFKEIATAFRRCVTTVENINRAALWALKERVRGQGTGRKVSGRHPEHGPRHRQLHLDEG